MYVNKLPSLLPSPNFPWLVLRNELVGSCFVNNTRSPSKFDSVRCLVNFFCGGSSGNAAGGVWNNQSQVSFAVGNANPKKNYTSRHLSRYSASTIMRPESKAFSFNDYHVIGFDLDGTLLRYNLDEMVPLEYEDLCGYLIEHKGYSKELFGLLDKSDDKDFLQKGLFLDAERGNLLKLDENSCIVRANHGTKAMSDDEIVSAYGEGRQWSVTSQFINDPMSAWNGPLAEKLRSLLDYFDIGVSLVFARAIDDADAKRKLNNAIGQPMYTALNDILEALINTYSRENFSNGKSGYFKALKSDPDRYLLKTPGVVIDWLRKLKASNKKIFLLTGSNIDFANFTASYALGENWRDLFDVAVCFARKPGFFYGSREFLRLEGFRETTPIALDDSFELNCNVYSMGNWKQLQKVFAQSINIDVNDMKSLYVGDNLIQDVYSPDVLAGIDSVAISEEMLSESATSEGPKDFKNIVVSRHWDSYFYDDGVPTIWAHTIAKHSKMCVPSVEHAATKPIDYEFKMNNEFGFYPSPPTSSS